MNTHASKAIVVLFIAGTVVLSGCSSEDPDPTPAPSETVTESPAPDPSGSSDDNVPSPSDSATTSRTKPTVADLERHLDGLIDSASGPGSLTCSGSGQISAGKAVNCIWRSNSSARASGPVHVAVLSDSGRYTFRLSGTPPNADATPDDYPSGTISCRTLAAPPSDSGLVTGLSYPSLLNYWMAAGRPASMDDDGNGVPCETVYDARVVARTMSSPLIPGNDSKSHHTLADINEHAEAVIGGIQGPGSLVPETRGQETIESDMTSRAVTGVQFSLDWVYDVPAQAGSVQVTVLRDSGRYAISHGKCCGGGPNVVDYDPGASCKQLSSRIPGSYQYWTGGLNYGNTVFYWMLHGSPRALDADGDGKPCERRYSKSEVAQYFSSTLEP